MIAFLLAGILVMSGDFVLLLPSGERVCAKSAEDCAAAQDAIRRGWWPVGVAAMTEEVKYIIPKL